MRPVSEEKPSPSDSHVKSGILKSSQTGLTSALKAVHSSRVAFHLKRTSCVSPASKSNNTYSWFVRSFNTTLSVLLSAVMYRRLLSTSAAPALVTVTVKVTVSSTLGVPELSPAYLLSTRIAVICKSGFTLNSSEYLASLLFSFSSKISPLSLFLSKSALASTYHSPPLINQSSETISLEFPSLMLVDLPLLPYNW